MHLVRCITSLSAYSSLSNLFQVWRVRGSSLHFQCNRSTVHELKRCFATKLVSKLIEIDEMSYNVSVKAYTIMSLEPQRH